MIFFFKLMINAVEVVIKDILKSYIYIQITFQWRSNQLFDGSQDVFMTVKACYSVGRPACSGQRT